MLNYLKKFALDILPSVAATIIGAYIVNHYIVTKPGADAPVAAAVSAADPKADPMPSRPSHGRVSNLPAAGVKAKGISEKAIMEKTAAERPTVVEKAQEKTEAKAEAKADAKSADTKSADVKSADAPVETASIPADPRRHPVAPREKVRVDPAVAGAARGVRRRSGGRDAAILRRRSRPRSRRKSAATPTIWRAPRSSVCAATARLLRARRRRPVLPRRQPRA